MSTLSVNGSRAIVASITLPYYGTWSADIALAETTDIPDDVTISVADMTLIGKVIRRGAFAGSRTLRIVGGKGGWRKKLPPRGYSHPAGVRLSSLLLDAARECGEQISVSSDRSVGSHWAREEGKGEQLLHLLLDGQWWMGTDGITQTSSRPSDPIATPFTVLSWMAGKGQFEVATEFISPWQPGRTFQAVNAPGTHTVSSVTIEAANDGKVRLHVMSTEGGTERLRADLRSLIQSEIASTSYAGVYEYSVAASSLGLTPTIDCVSSDPRMPSLIRVPTFGIGVVSPSVGSKCRIRFVNADPARPECIALDGTTEHMMTIEATALLIYNVLVALMTAAGGGPLLAAVLQPLIVPSILAAMSAQSAPAPPGVIAQTILNTTLAAAMSSGTSPSNAIGALAAGLASIDTKSLDVSGFFPGVGVPNG